MTNGQGSAIAINSYDDYGIPASTNLGRFQYTGQAWLPEVGLYYYKARMYSPTLGRFMQTDPIGYGDGMNMYAYVGNDPVNKVDSSGLGATCTVGGVEAICVSGATESLSAPIGIDISSVSWGHMGRVLLLTQETLATELRSEML